MSVGLIYRQMREVGGGEVCENEIEASEKAMLIKEYQRL